MTLVPNTRDPGTVKGDLGEADLDLEWAGATAPQASILYVYSADVMDAVQYIIDQNLAPVLSLSYGLCEPLTLRSDMLTMQSWARQANAQGMTWLNASGRFRRRRLCLRQIHQRRGTRGGFSRRYPRGHRRGGHYVHGRLRPILESDQ